MAVTAEASRDARWSTSDFSSDQAFSRWMELVSETIAPTHIDSLDRKPFSASRRRIGLGPIELNILEASSQRVRRTRSMISRQKPDYDLLYLQEGAGELEHCGNKIRVPTGSFVLLDNQQPYELLFPNGSVWLAIHFEISASLGQQRCCRTLNSKLTGSATSPGPVASRIRATSRVASGSATESTPSVTERRSS